MNSSSTLYGEGHGTRVQDQTRGHSLQVTYVSKYKEQVQKEVPWRSYWYQSRIQHLILKFQKLQLS